MVLLLSEVLRCDIELSVVRVLDSEDLLKVGEQLQRGDCHLAAVWGLEYGWLRERFGDGLRPLVVASQGTSVELRSAWPTQLMVAPGFSGAIADLKGTVLATYKSSPMMNTLFLDKLLADSGYTPERFFADKREYETPVQAVHAVRHGDAACIVVDALTYGHHVSSQPNSGLKSIRDSGLFPEPVLIGSPGQVNGVAHDLWRRLQDELVVIHHTRAGQESCDFWRVTAFLRPDEHFYEVVRSCVRDYPFTSLLKSAQGRRRRM